MPRERPEWLQADWPAPSWIRAGTTTRAAGRNSPPYTRLDLARHAGDDPARVNNHRARLARELALPGTPLWLRQVHSNRVIGSSEWQEETAAEGCFTGEQDVVCAVLSADCLPLLMCNRAGSRVVAAHAGWRGLCAGIVDKALAVFPDPPDDILVWIGPHIHARHYEVGEEVRHSCLLSFPGAEHAFTPGGVGRWFADLAALAQRGLRKQGVNRIYAAGSCTYEDATRFYSYRRDRITGRMASLIWMESTGK